MSELDDLAAASSSPSYSGRAYSRPRPGSGAPAWLWVVGGGVVLVFVVAVVGLVNRSSGPTERTVVVPADPPARQVQPPARSARPVVQRPPVADPADDGAADPDGPVARNDRPGLTPPVTGPEHVGARGGVFHYSASGKRVYEKKR